MEFEEVDENLDDNHLFGVFGTEIGKKVLARQHIDDIVSQRNRNLFH